MAQTGGNRLWDAYAARFTPVQLPAIDASALPDLRNDYVLRVGHPPSIPEGVFRQSVRHPGVPGYCISYPDGDASAVAPHLVSADYRTRLVQQGYLCIDRASFRELGFQVSAISIRGLLIRSPFNRKRSRHGHHRCRTSADLSAGAWARSLRFAILHLVRGAACHRSRAGTAGAREPRIGATGNRIAVATSACGAGSSDARITVATRACGAGSSDARIAVATSAHSAGSTFPHEPAAGLQSLRRHRRRPQSRGRDLHGM
jgi:hypothetical protein